MKGIFEIDKILYDTNVWLAIIAINMTIIGLTSLAESKKIIGVDYGKFLIKHYKVSGLIRIYHLLIIFACINTVSLITMFMTNETVRIVNILVLLLSLIFAIYYFFSFILIENHSVKCQIHKNELLGIYYKSDDKTTFLPDIIVNMKDGWRTEKRLSTNVITYFDTFNSETQKSFEEIFGPKSIIYDSSYNISKYWNENFGKQPFDYKNNQNLNFISHEFFQLFRYSELQEKWILEILRIFNLDYSTNNREYKMDNLIRILGHIIRFGKSENLYGYKFLEYMEVHIFDCFEKNENKELIEKEKFLIKEISEFIFIVLDRNENQHSYKIGEKILSKLITENQSHGNMDINEIIKIIFEEGKDYENKSIRRLLIKLYNLYLSQPLRQPLGVKEIKRILAKKESQANELVTLNDIFS